MTKAEAPVAVADHTELFELPVYIEQADRKREFEDAHDPEEVARVREWSKSWEYRERNFARTGLTINPIKACQPLGAVLAALGFSGTLPLVHGSQGCVAYFRSHLTRHFKEPTPTISSSMTEDGAVFGGMPNLIEALGNATSLYKPDMIAVSTTCMAEVIGDDLQNFIANAKAKGTIADDYPVPFAHTPSFVGSHLVGYDAMLRGILLERTKGVARDPNQKINIIPGFVTNVGDLREIKRLLTMLGVKHTILGDASDTFDSPATGDYQMYPGGTPLADAAGSINATGTLLLQDVATRKTAEMIRTEWNQPAEVLTYPIGVANTDQFILRAAAMAGVDVPAELTAERGRLIDAMADSHAYLHGKRVAIAGDPDLVLPVLGFLLELGMQPVHVLASNGDNAFVERASAVCSASPFGQSATIWKNHDLWHLRSLVHTEPVDLLIGSSHLKYLSREAEVPLIRFGFPIFDRHHLHRFPVLGYAGGINLLAQMVNTVLDELDRSATDTNFDLVR